ncbi:hypothetical protein CBR_g38992 [Chara braunii]|uniref:Reverse transcriptase n=1 Tax=Chara braunii TaxID=69332 RepID=A0A388K0U0_CHABU|nr:hypothetical protein CBR_g38992 [Chara braunii]|eukprot:GBG63680.1 hypothetical protein CBR_g38992 [Chara braunii]
MLNYDGGDEVKMKINVEGAKEVEMRMDGKLQDAITEAKDRAERRCRRDRVTARLQVTVSYHETETSMDTADLEQAHVDRDSNGESEMSEAGDWETDLRSWIRPGEIQRHHQAAKPVEEGPEASSRQLTPRGRRAAPVLHLPDYSRPFIVTTDTSDFAIGAVLSQIYPASSTSPNPTESRLPRILRFPPPPPATAARLAPIEPTPSGAPPPYTPDVADDDTVESRDGECSVAYLSRQLLPAERNYTTDEREVLALVYAVKKWRHHLHGHTFTVLTDNSVLAAFQTKPKLTPRQARWWRDLAEFDFTIKKITGESNRVADALSRRPDLQCDDRQLSAISFPIIHPAFLDEYRSAYPQCSEFQSIYADLQAGKTVPNFQLDPSGLLYWLGRQGNRTPRLCVPSVSQLRVQAVAECHDQRAAGHLGILKTLDRLYCHYYWEHRRPFTTEYVRTCRTCQEASIPNHPPYGLLQPLPIPTQRWTSVSMDFIGPLCPPTPRGYDAIFVVVCWLTKHAHFLPCKYASSAKDITTLYFNRIAIHHGLPTSIVSDRDPRFTSHFWRGLHETYGSELRLSSSYHPQSDGQTEVTNKTLGTILKKFVENDSDWDLHLAHAEIAYNHAISPATGMSPYYCDLGYHPRVPSDLLRPSQIHPDTKCPTLDEWVKEMDALLNKARESIAHSQTRMATRTNRSRIDYPFKVGDEVLVDARHFQPEADTLRKFRRRYIGSCTILAPAGPNHDYPVSFKLKLPDSMYRANLHDVFHVSLLRPFRRYPPEFHGRPYPRPSPIIIEGHEEFVVSDIVSRRMTDGDPPRFEYLVRWKGYPDEESTWEPLGHMKHAMTFVRAYDQKGTY